MKLVLGLSGVGAAMALAGVEGFSSGMLGVATLAAVGCWVVSGWIIG